MPGEADRSRCFRRRRERPRHGEARRLPRPLGRAPRRHLRRRPGQRPAPAAPACADDRRHRLGGDADRHRDHADHREEGRRLAPPPARLGDPRPRTHARPARRLSRPRPASTRWSTRSRPIPAGTRRTRSPINLRGRLLRFCPRNIREVCRNGANLEARSQMLLGSMLAGMAFANAPVAAVHALAYPIGGDLPRSARPLQCARAHGCAALQPAASRRALCASSPRSSIPARAIFLRRRPRVPSWTRSNRSAATAACRRRLRKSASAKSISPRLAEDAMKQTRLLVNNPREVTYADAYAIYSEAFDGKSQAGGLSDGEVRAMNPFESMQSLAMLWGKTAGQAFADVYGDDFKAMVERASQAASRQHRARDLRSQLREGAPVLYSGVVHRKRTLDLARQRTFRRQRPKAVRSGRRRKCSPRFSIREGWLSVTSEIDEALQRMAEGPRLSDLWNIERKFARRAQCLGCLAPAQPRAQHGRPRRLDEGRRRVRQAVERPRRGRASRRSSPCANCLRSGARPRTASSWRCSVRRLSSRRSATFLKASTDLRLAQRYVAEFYSEMFGYPTRSELDDVHKTRDRAAAGAARHAARRRAEAAAVAAGRRNGLLSKAKPAARKRRRPPHERELAAPSKSSPGRRPARSRRSARRSPRERSSSTKSATRTSRSPRRRRTRSGGRTRSRSTATGRSQSRRSRPRS